MSTPPSPTPDAPPRRRMPWSFRLWFWFLGLVAAGMIAAAVWSALVVMEAGPQGYRGMNRGLPATPPASTGQ